MIRILEVPEAFLPKMPVSYPPHQGTSPMIEERAFSFFSLNKNLESDYIYIPIQWTSWHINPYGEYGQNAQPLIDYCNQLSEKYPNEKFFTIVQYDGGTLVPIDNCKIFASSGSFSSPIGKNSTYEPIPLLCDPHDGYPNEERQYKVGYVGRDTHGIRKKMHEVLKNESDYKLITDYGNTQIFREVLYNSVFALSPRGFGPASYRMYEAIQMCCIPIYISDEFWIPFEDRIDWKRMSLIIGENEIDSIPSKVDRLLETGEYQDFINYGQEVYEKYLTWDGCLNTIADIISK